MVGSVCWGCVYVEDFDIFGERSYTGSQFILEWMKEARTYAAAMDSASEVPMITTSKLSSILNGQRWSAARREPWTRPPVANMRSSLLRHATASGSPRKPLIHFIGKRSWPTTTSRLCPTSSSHLSKPLVNSISPPHHHIFTRLTHFNTRYNDHVNHRPFASTTTDSPTDSEWKPRRRDSLPSPIYTDISQLSYQPKRQTLKFTRRHTPREIHAMIRRTHILRRRKRRLLNPVYGPWRDDSLPSPPTHTIRNSKYLHPKSRIQKHINLTQPLQKKSSKRLNPSSLVIPRSRLLPEDDEDQEAVMTMSERTLEERQLISLEEQRAHVRRKVSALINFGKLRSGFGGRNGWK
jgi:hypothetical protein